MNMKNWFEKFLKEAPDGGQGGGAPVDPPTDPVDPPAGGDVPVAPDFSFMPEQFRSGENPDFEGFAGHYNELATAAAQAKEAAALVPEDASGYELALPEGLDFSDIEGLPEGFQMTLDTESEIAKPHFDALKGLLHKHGLPGSAAGDFLGLLARYDAAGRAAAMKSGSEEMAKLGANAQSRVSDVRHLLDARLPAELAKGLEAATHSAAGVQALEKLLGPRGFTPAASQPSDPKPQDTLSARYDKG